MPQICNMGQTALLPLRRKACWGFFRPKIWRLRPGLNPRSWVPEASTLTTRPPKPLSNPTLPTWLVTCNSTANGKGCYIPHCLIPISSNLQQTPMSSELAPPGFWHSHLFLLHWNISLGASVKQMLKHQWWPHGDVMCTIRYTYTSKRCRTSSWLTFTW